MKITISNCIGCGNEDKEECIPCGLCGACIMDGCYCQMAFED